jgi:hypothetical protein
MCRRRDSCFGSPLAQPEKTRGVTTVTSVTTGFLIIPTTYLSAMNVTKVSIYTGDTGDTGDNRRNPGHLLSPVSDPRLVTGAILVTPTACIGCDLS